MPFILIAKASDGSLRLLTESAFQSRAEALSELSRITADPSFDRWDDEVLALDLDSGTPVLLVRPADSATTAAEPEEVQPEVTAEETEVDESVEESETAFAAEAEEAEGEEAAEGDEAEEEAPSLKEALKRTTVQLESEGIVAPESVGPAEESEDTETAEEPASEAVEAAEEQGESPAPAAWPWDTAPADKGFDLDALEAPGNDEGSLVRAPGDDETMAVARPLIMGAYGESAEEAVAVTEEAVATAEDEQAPQDEPQEEPQPAPEPEAQVERGPQEEPDAQLAPTEPAEAPEVEFAPEEPAPASEPAPEEREAPEPAPASEPMGVAEPSTEDAIDSLLADVAATHGETESVSESSDFVDLPPASVAPSIDTMTCDDCVYTDSCPNKGQMAPASCGSFQWK